MRSSINQNLATIHALTLSQYGDSAFFHQTPDWSKGLIFSPSTAQYEPEKLELNCGEEGGENPDYGSDYESPDYEIVPTDSDVDIFGSNEPLECGSSFGCPAPKCECSEIDAGVGFCEPCTPERPSPGPVTEPRVSPTTDRGPSCGYRNPSGAASVSVRKPFQIVS